MSFKFRRDGAVFPTEVKNGELIIHVGSAQVVTPFKFLTEDYQYDNTDFPMCNVMCYLRNATSILVMRFDGTVTRYNNDMIVTGFSKFDKELIYDKTMYIPHGTVGKVAGSSVVQHMQCTIYRVHNTANFILEVIGDPEAIEFNAEDNPLFIHDIANGSRYFPRLIKESTNHYVEDDGRYSVIGRAIKTTGYIEL